jgi:small conductance mechanosensitive channel
MREEKIQQIMDTVIPLITTYGLRIVGAVLILVIGRIIAGILGRLVERMMIRGKVDVSLRGFFVSLVKIMVLAFAVVASLAKFGVETTSFVALLGAAGFAIGFALQGSLGNFASGVMILIFKPIKVGDLVEIAGYLGVVDEIGLFVTIINTPDNQRVIVPNGKITSEVINNVNGNGTRRVDLQAGISYSDDIDKAKAICLEVMRRHESVLQDPAPFVGVSKMDDSSVNLAVRPWCHGDDYWTVFFDITQAVKEAFDAAGITIPFPQHDVHMIDQKSAG